jgi:hypothetical protein
MDNSFVPVIVKWISKQLKLTICMNVIKNWINSRLLPFNSMIDNREYMD